MLIVGCEELQNDQNSVTKTVETNIEKETIKPKYGGIYRRAISYNYLKLDPAHLRESTSNEVCKQIYDGLVEFTASDTISPCLAESWKISDNKLIYTFKLRNDVHFHKEINGIKTKNGGRLFTAEDVLFTFKRLFAHSSNNENIFYREIKGAKDYCEGKTTELSGIRVLASDTIEFELEHPFAPFISTLAVGNAFIVPHEDADNLEKMPVGTGAFKWKTVDKNCFKLDANTEYFRGRPYLDGIEFIVIDNEDDRVKEFIAGYIHQLDVPEKDYQNIKHENKYSHCILESRLWGLNFLGMNVTKPPFDNKLVRQCLNYAIDREAIVNLVFNGKAQVANVILNPGIVGHNPLMSEYKYDVNKAKKLLAEAGYPDGKGFPVISLQIEETHQDKRRLADFVIANLKDIGIECKVEVVDFKTHLERISKGEAPFFRLGWKIDYPDPDGLLYTLFHSSNISNGYNACYFSNSEVDKLLDNARTETEMDIRLPMYEKAENIIIEEAPMVFLYFYTINILHQPNVHGLKIGSIGETSLQYRNVYFNP